MIGLVILIAGVIYLALLIWATRAAYRWAKNKGLPKSKCWAAAAGGFMVVYLPVFWDHIPTLVTYQYSCMTEAGFWEYQSIDDWRKENPGVAETLVYPRIPRHSSSKEGKTATRIDFISQRFQWISQKTGPLPVNRWRLESELVDRATGKVLARAVDFSAGDGRVGGDFAIRFWLQLGLCSDKGGYDLEVGRISQRLRAVGKVEELQ